MSPARCRLPVCTDTGWEGENLRNHGGFGLPVPREPAYADKRSQDGEAKSESSERRTGCPQRTSGDGRTGSLKPASPAQ